ncbi:MAG: sigma-70 family RNA polymerase sigma factor [Bacilli bacterium]
METFEKCFESYERLIWHSIKRLHIYKDHDEFYQIGLIALWRAFRHYDASRGAFTTYAYATIEGHLKMQLRKQLRYTSDWATHKEETTMDCYPSLRLLENCTLCKEEYTVLKQKFESDWTFAQIAQKNGLSVNSVKTIYYRALKKLKTTKF